MIKLLLSHNNHPAIVKKKNNILFKLKWVPISDADCHK